MATARLGPIVSDVRGSVGDQTFGRNQGGIFIRERVSPQQPASSDRDATQAAMTALSQAWSATLNEAQRSTWMTYGKRHPLPDRFGRPRALAGICHFVRCNFHRYRDESAITATSAPLLPPPPMPSFSFNAFTTAALDVTGNPDPDVTGLYQLVGAFDSHPLWKLDGADRWLAWHQPFTIWVLIGSPGPLTGPFWHRVDPVTGQYTPQAPATGNPSAAWTDPPSYVHIELPLLNYDPPPTNLRLFAYAGAQVTQGRNYYRTPYRYIGRNTYDGADWSIDPWYVGHWEDLDAGARTFVRLVAVLDDGATSVAGHARADT